MNERITKIVIDTLGKEGVVNSRAFGHWALSDEELEKFAELIVRECADIAYKTSWDDLVHGYGQAVIPLHLHNTIKEHFGVEL